MLFTHDLIITLTWIVALMVWVFFFVRYRTNKLNKRAELVSLMIEKNPDVDIDEFLKKISPKKRLLKEKLLAKLHTGSVLSLGGIALFGWSLFIDFSGENNAKGIYVCYLMGIVLFAMGIAFIINYFVGKKMLAKEIEAEEKKLTSEV
jgi:hypothetical protein